MNELENCSTCGVKLDENQNSVYRDGVWYGYCNDCYRKYMSERYRPKKLKEKKANESS